MSQIQRPAPGRLLPLWAAILVAAAAGVILDTASPSVGWWPLAFVGVGLALITLIGRSGWGALTVGLVFGSSFYLVHIIWITRYLGVVPWFALSGLQALIMGLGSILITLAYRWFPRVFPSRSPRLIGLPLLVAGVWTMRELVMGSWPYTGFPWGRIGMTQSESPLASVVSWTGTTGLTFLMVALCAAVIEWVRVARWREWRTAVPAAACVAILLLTPTFPTTASGTMAIGSVQGNGPTGYFDDRAANEILNSQLAATTPLLGQDLDLLVWPEGGIDSDPLRNTRTASALDLLAKRIGAPLLVNAVTERDGLTYNTSMVWEAGRGAVALHDKTVPVPMGEYVPNREFFALLAPDLINLIQREYSPGTRSPLVVAAGVPIGLAICFDVLYDDVIWTGAREGAEVFVFQTNNADFRDTDENVQQLAFARMRAIETGRAVVNISTVGTSQVIDADGTTLDELRADTVGTMLNEVPLYTGLTPASVIGPAVAGIIGWGTLLTLIGLGVLQRVRRHRAPTERAAALKR